MKQITFFLISAVCASTQFYASENASTNRNKSKQLEKIPTTIEARFSYFYPESSEVRSILGNGWIDYQLTGTVPVYQKDNFGLRGLNFWWAFDYFEKKGHSLGLHNSIHLQSEQLTAGLKWIYPEYVVRPFFGVGFKYNFAQTHNDSSFVKKHVSKSTPGFVLETGIQIFLAKYLMMDLFASYSFAHYGSPPANRSNVTPESLDLGGLNFGGGIGVKF